ncbi:MAG: hypothetical protein KDK41_03890 [Leptospiraceae bacterium]|nr:hypothetical protein [Leptospiraceae bacterium]
MKKTIILTVGLIFAPLIFSAQKNKLSIEATYARIFADNSRDDQVIYFGSQGTEYGSAYSALTGYHFMQGFTAIAGYSFNRYDDLSENTSSITKNLRKLTYHLIQTGIRKDFEFNLDLAIRFSALFLYMPPLEYRYATIDRKSSSAISETVESYNETIGFKLVADLKYSFSENLYLTVGVSLVQLVTNNENLEIKTTFAGNTTTKPVIDRNNLTIATSPYRSLDLSDLRIEAGMGYEFEI